MSLKMQHFHKKNNGQNDDNDLPKLLSIEAINNIVLSEYGKIIHPRKKIWQRKNANRTYFQVGYDLNSSNEPKLLVHLTELDIIKSNATLQAYAISKGNKIILFSGKITEDCSSTTLDSITKPCALSKLPGNTLNWEILMQDGEVISLGSSLIEMFWVNLKSFPSSLSRKGIPVEILRYCTGIFSIDEIDVPSVATIVNNVFGNIPPRYDIVAGAYHFLTIPSFDNITLHYNAYVHARNHLPASVLNCYDAAAILQYTLSLSNYPTKFCYMDPFGYLLQTDLIGRGQCNNPFYGATGDPAVINRTDFKRTAFANHAFISLTLTNTVADACAGPHTGGETAEQYVNYATDSRYPNPPQTPRGTVSNIRYYLGVRNVDVIHSIINLPEIPHMEDFKKVVMFSDKEAAYFSGQYIAGKWPEILDYSLLHGSWEKCYEEIVPGEEEVLKMAFYKKDEKMITIKIYISSSDNNKISFNRFLSLSLSQTSEYPYKKGPDDLGFYSAVSMRDDQEYRRCFWVYHNAVVDILSNEDTLDVVELSKWYHKWAQKNITDDLVAHLPSVEVIVSGLSETSSGEIHISLIETENMLIDYVHTPESPRLIFADDKTLVFDTPQPGHKELTLLAVDKTNLLVGKQTLKLNA